MKKSTQCYSAAETNMEEQHSEISRRRFFKRAGLLALGATIAPDVVIARPEKGRGTQYERPTEKELSPIQFGEHKILRTALRCRSGDCVLLHKDINLLPRDTYLKHPSLATLIEGDPSTKKDNSRFFEDENNPWCVGKEKGSPMFNCHAYAVGERVGLNVRDWLEGMASGLTENRNPLQTILDDYFQEIGVYKHESGFVKVAGDATLEIGDIIAFAKKAGDATEFVHSGRIIKENGENWLVGKFGEGPLLVSPLTTAGKEYADLFNEIRVYRLKPRQ